MTNLAVDSTGRHLPVGAIDSALATLGRGEQIWAGTPCGRRRALLDQIRVLVDANAQAWVDAAAGLKGLPSSSPLVGEEWLSGPYAMITALRALAESLDALDRGRSPVDDYPIIAAPGGRVAVKVLPHSIYDRLLLSGLSAEVWMKPGVTADAVRGAAGLAEREPSRTRGVGVVLGAGNITAIAPLDAVYELYANNRVVALKLNPVMDAMLPVYQRIFAPLIDLGVLVLVTGGAGAGDYLVNHAAVDHVHITGSAATHDAIVWGSGAEGARRRAADEPRLNKPITSELGGVSPIIVLPGSWTKADLRFQAQHIATMRLHNGGYNCVAGQVVVLSADWPQKDAFLAEIRRALATAPERAAYYPGSAGRVAAACAAYPDAEVLASRVLVTGAVDSTYLMRTETFAPVLGVIELPGARFLEEAVRTANEDFVGTLGVNVVAHPRTIKHLGARFDAALAALQYGAMAVNAWTAVVFLTAPCSWGAFPGHSLNDIQSGIGIEHNALLLAEPERSIVRGPFRPLHRSLLHGELAILPKPPWFVHNRTAAGTTRLMTDFVAAPRWWKLPRIFASALRG